jgi:hypothetical protein
MLNDFLGLFNPLGHPMSEKLLIAEYGVNRDDGVFVIRNPYSLSRRSSAFSS